jgi:hypothetical protein
MTTTFNKRQSCCSCCGTFVCTNRLIPYIVGNNVYGGIMGTIAGPKAWCYDPDPADFSGDFSPFGWATTLMSYGEWPPSSFSTSGITLDYDDSACTGTFALNLCTLQQWYSYANLGSAIPSPSGNYAAGLAYYQYADEFRLAFQSTAGSPARLLYSLAASSWNPCDSNTLSLIKHSGTGIYPSTITLTQFVTPPGGDPHSPSGCECQNPVCPGQLLPMSIPWVFTPDPCPISVVGCGSPVVAFPTLSGTLEIELQQSGLSGTDILNLSYVGGECVNLARCNVSGGFANRSDLVATINLFLGTDGNIYYQFGIGYNCNAEFVPDDCGDPNEGSNGSCGWFTDTGLFYTPGCPGLGGTISLSLAGNCISGAFGKCSNPIACNPLTGTLVIG